MLARAARAVDACGPGRGLVVRGDISALPFDASAFDVVVSTGVLGRLTVATRRHVLQEMVRVSRGELRLLEPIVRTDRPPRPTHARIVALVRDRPLTLDELVEIGLAPEVRGPPAIASVYSMVRATSANRGRAEPFSHLAVGYSGEP